MNLYLGRRIAPHSQQGIRAIEKLQRAQGVLPLDVVTCNREVRVRITGVDLQGALIAGLCPCRLTQYIGRQAVVDQAQRGATRRVTPIHQISDSHRLHGVLRSAEGGTSENPGEPQRGTQERGGPMMYQSHRIGSFLNKLAE